MNWIQKPKYFFTLSVLMIFLMHGFLLSENNALPFFYKDYPTYSNNGKANFDRASEELVLSRIDFEILGLEYSSQFHLWRPFRSNQSESAIKGLVENQKEERIHALQAGSAYKSQLGIQSWFHSKLSGVIGQDFDDYQPIKRISVFLFALFLATILTWIKKNIGLYAGIGALIYSCLSTGFVIFSTALFWSPFLFLLPLAWVYGWQLLEWKNEWLMYIGLLPLLLFKFLAGYEFITVLGLSLALPFLFQFFHQQSFFPWLKLVQLFLIFVIAFGLSLAFYQWNFQNEFNESGFTYLFGRSESWTLAGLSEKGIEPLSQLLKIILLNFMDINGYGIPLVLFLLGAGIASFVLRKSISKADVFMLGLVFLSSMSWFIVQFGHMLFHPRYTTFVLAFPFGIFICAYIGKWMHVYLEKKQNEKA
jgi:hypothetical protein